MNGERMLRASLNGTELEYQVFGSGEPVVLVHGSILADGFYPLLADPAFSSRFEEYRIIYYHRRGYAGSRRPEGQVSIAQQAADCLALLRHLQIGQAHVTGHSYGGTIALQAALDGPEQVHSLALLEPLLLPREDPRANQYTEKMLTRGMELYAKGNKGGAAVEFLKMAAGDDVWDWVDRMLPRGAIDLAAADADTFFQVEAPALLGWGHTQESLRRLRLEMPVLSVLGSRSDSVWPGFQEGHRFLQSWLPQTETFVLADTTHAMQISNPRGAGEALMGFLERHPM